jgi:hypothetical protein
MKKLSKQLFINTQKPLKFAPKRHCQHGLKSDLTEQPLFSGIMKKEMLCYIITRV